MTTETKNRTTEKHLPLAGFRWVSDKMKMWKMLYTTEFTYSAKIVQGGMKLQDAINTDKDKENEN